MQVIPVIDLKGGVVVHARHGARDSYRPIASPLCRGSRPADVVAGLLAVHPFETLYIADLDAIAGSGDHDATVRALAEAFPRLALWVDRGLNEERACRAWLERHGGATLVLGSEAIGETDLLRRLRDRSPRLALSLDYRADRFLGPTEILDRVEDWPRRVIVMTLARVGSGAGPDLERLDEVRGRAPRCEIYAAGGVRDGADLQALARRGVSGVLVATALHDRRIGPDEIAAAARSRPA
ncbi:MAG: nickel transporter [Rhodospirillaceae bacterium]|nr:nickel transporter [Rhodospirillaceae bacterium]